MNEIEALKQAWSGLEQKLNKNWKLNMALLRTTKLDTAKRKMHNLIWKKSVTLGFYGLFTFLFISYALSRWPVPHQVITGVVLAIWSLSFTITSAKELNLILSIDYSQAIPLVQRQLIEVKMAIIRYLRLGVWILPLYFSFVILFFDVILGVDIVERGEQTWLISNLLFSVVVFIPVALWIHHKLGPRNAGKKWMNSLLLGNGSQINDALMFLDDIKTYEDEDSSENGIIMEP